MNQTLELLRLLTQRFKPLRGHAHQIVMHDGKLQINLVHVAPCWKITLSEDDLRKDPVRLHVEIVKLLAQKDPPTPAA